MTADAKASMQKMARELLQSGNVQFVLGYRQVPGRFTTTPFYARTPKDADLLHWGPNCTSNLVTFALAHLKRKPARGEKPDTRPVVVVAKPCDGKSVIALLQEHQFDREKMMVIGMPCSGQADSELLESALDGKDICGGEVSLIGNDCSIEANGKLHTIPLGDVRQAKCGECDSHNPTITDVDVGPQVNDPPGDDPPPYRDVEEMDPDQRWEMWERELSKCIRCYACRNACPMCYCEECIAEKRFPPWIGKSHHLPDNIMWNVLRAIHLAGRCIDCGECDRACPMDIPLRKINRKLQDVVKDKYGYVPGKDPETPSFVTTFDLDDEEEFIK